MTSTYRRDHILTVKNDEWEWINATARADVIALVNALSALYPGPVTAGETKALYRACARYLIDSGKASAAGVLE